MIFYIASQFDINSLKNFRYVINDSICRKQLDMSQATRYVASNSICRISDENGVGVADEFNLCHRHSLSLYAFMQTKYHCEAITLPKAISLCEAQYHFYFLPLRRHLCCNLYINDIIHSRGKYKKNGVSTPFFIFTFLL